jgi:glycosyltransferase involved in cell wall biosynthesis
MSKIVFYTHDSVANLKEFEYYKQDIDALRALGHEVVICTSYLEIPFIFDAMFVWWWTHALVPVLLCRILRRPCIITGTFNFRFPDIFEGKDYFRRPHWQKLLIRSALRLCSLNLFVSQLELEQCSKYFGLDNASHLPHCLHDDYVKGPSTKRRKALLNLAWCGKDNLVRKGIPELLSAVRLLKDRGEDVTVYLAGIEGDGTEYLLETIKKLRIVNEVHYLGSLSRQDKIKMLRENEIYVQPSHYEGFGLAILESMGCGACVIVRDVGAVREVVGDCGVYVPSSSSGELAIAIERVLRDNVLRERLQKSGYERAKSLFTFDKKVERLGAFLRSLGVLDPGPPALCASAATGNVNRAATAIASSEFCRNGSPSKPE